MRSCFLVCTLLFAFFKTSSSQATPNFGEPVFDMDFVDRAPMFPGGDWEFLDFFQKNLVLPTGKRLDDIDKITTEFIVETDGSVTELEFPVSTVLDDSVRKLFLKMPKWEPGMHRGHLVRVRFRLPIFVKIN